MPFEQFSSELGFKRLDRGGDGRLCDVETRRGSRNLTGFGGCDEVAHLTESQCHKKIRYQRPIFRVLQLLAAAQKIKRFLCVFEKASQ
jgi:hypothetical protein